MGDYTYPCFPGSTCTNGQCLLAKCKDGEGPMPVDGNPLPHCECGIFKGICMPGQVCDEASSICTAPN